MSKENLKLATALTNILALTPTGSKSNEATRERLRAFSQNPETPGNALGADDIEAAHAFLNTILNNPKRTGNAAPAFGPEINALHSAKLLIQTMQMGGNANPRIGNVC